MTLAALAALEEAQRCLLRYQLETLAFPTREATGEDPVAERPDRLEHERNLRSAIELYASLKDGTQSAGARDPPVP